MMDRRRLAGLVIVGVAIVSILVTATRESPVSRTMGPAGGVVGLIYIEGTITGGRTYPAFSSGSPGGDIIVGQIKSAARDPDVKAIVLRLNTPGGSAAASQEIAAEVERARKMGKKVVASMGDVCASGGYWIASSANKIVASPATLTGSIGVIMEVTQAEQLMKKIGLEFEVIKSGPHKDIGSPTRKLESDERELLQQMVDDIYVQFIQTVSAGRSLDLETVRSIADGRIFTGKQAKELGLVDELGNLEDAVEEAAELAGLSSWRVKDFDKRTFFDKIMGVVEGAAGRNPLLDIGLWYPIDGSRFARLHLLEYRGW